MKTLFIYALLFFSLNSFSTVDEVVSALKNGNASQVSKYFDNTVELTLPDKSNSYSKSQAALVLQDFFSTSGVKNFQVLHKGDNIGAQFCTGVLQTKSGQYRTTIYLKLKGDSYLLQEIKFEK